MVMEHQLSVHLRHDHCGPLHILQADHNPQLAVRAQAKISPLFLLNQHRDKAAKLNTSQPL